MLSFQFKKNERNGPSDFTRPLSGIAGKVVKVFVVRFVSACGSLLIFLSCAYITERLYLIASLSVALSRSPSLPVPLTMRFLLFSVTAHKLSNRGDSDIFDVYMGKVSFHWSEKNNKENRGISRDLQTKPTVDSFDTKTQW